MINSYESKFQCDDGDDPNWTDFSLGAANSGGPSASPPTDETFKTIKTEGSVDLQGGVSVKTEDEVKPSVAIEEKVPGIKTEDGDSLRDLVNFKEVVGTFKIFVSSLPPTATNEQLREMFAPYGTVLDCEVFQHKSYAFVHMDSVTSGNDAVRDLNGIEFDGSTIRVQRSTSFPVQKPFSNSIEVGTFKLFISQFNEGVTKEIVKGFLEKYGRIVDIEIYRNNSAFVHMEEESAGRTIMRELNGQLVTGNERRLLISESKNPEGPNVPTITIHVRNFAAHVTPEKIRSLFQPYGLVMKCTITDPHVDLLRKAVVLFEQLGDVRSAINELNNFELDGQKLSVKPIFDEPAPPVVTTPVKKQPPLLSTPPTGFGGQRGFLAAGPPARGRGAPTFPRGMSRGGGNVPFSHQQVTPSGTQNWGGRGRGITTPSNRGRGNFGPPVNRNFQLVPMPSKEEINQSNRSRGNFRGGRGIRGSRGFGRGGYQNQGFDQDTYDFDEYYQDQKAASSREHLSEFANQRGVNFEPLQKKAKVQLPYSNSTTGSQPQALMGIDFHSDIIQEQPLAQPNSALQSYEQVQKQNQAHSLFSTNPNYFSSDQIAGSSTNHSNFDGQGSSSTSSSVGLAAYPANYYAGIAGAQDLKLNAVPFDYSNLRRGRGGGVAGKGIGRGAGNKFQMQTEFPPGVNPADFPDLKPGSKVYVNGRGKVMVRGAKTNPKGRSRPGLGTKGARRGGINSSGASTSNGDSSLISPNQMPLGGGAGPSTSYAKSFNLFGAKKSRVQVKEDNQEYTDWLQKKSWLHTPIPGIVKPVSKQPKF